MNNSITQNKKNRGTETETPTQLQLTIYNSLHFKVKNLKNHSGCKTPYQITQYFEYREGLKAWDIIIPISVCRRQLDMTPVPKGWGKGRKEEYYEEVILLFNQIPYLEQITNNMLIRVRGIYGVPKYLFGKKVQEQFLLLRSKHQNSPIRDNIPFGSCQLLGSYNNSQSVQGGRISLDIKKEENMELYSRMENSLAGDELMLNGNLNTQDSILIPEINPYERRKLSHSKNEHDGNRQNEKNEENTETIIEPPFAENLVDFIVGHN